MQYFLAREEPVELTDKFPIGIRGKCGSVTMHYQVSEDSPGYNQGLSEELSKMLSQFQEDVEIDVRIILMEPQSLCKGIIQLHEEHPYLKQIIKLPGVENATVIARIRLLEQSSGEATPPNTIITTKGMAVMDDSEKTCEDYCIQFPDRNWYHLFHERDVCISARLSIGVTVHLKNSEQSVPPQLVLFKKMLHEEILSDLDIITSDEKRIKCHKSVLSACSPVFRKMFQTEMVENVTSTVEIPDMTEDIVRAFLEFVYYMGDEAANKSCKIAFELWLVADKYDVTPDLKTAMRDILLSKPVEWYNVDVAAKLFQMARNVGAEQLKTKAVNILKEHMALLNQSAVYKEMFEKNPDAAMEFVQLSN